MYCDDFSKIPEITKGILNDKECKAIIDKLNKITKEDYFMTEEEALKWADWIEKSIYDEGMKEGIKQGVEQGIEKNKQEIIQSMLENNINLETISRVTNKTIEEIQDILEK